jgi:hypothetical protein
VLAVSIGSIALGIEALPYDYAPAIELRGVLDGRPALVVFQVCIAFDFSWDRQVPRT